MKLQAKIDEEQIAKMDLTISIRMTFEEWRGVMRGDSFETSILQRRISDVLGTIANATRANISVVDPGEDVDAPA